MNFKISPELKKILFDPTMGKLITLVVSFTIIYILSKALQGYFARKINDNSLRYRTKKAIGFLGFILTLFVSGFIFSEKLGGLTVALGVAGAGIAFALQEVIASIAGWFAINFNNFFKVGDRVQLGGIKGDVIDIGILRTTLMEVGDWVKGDLYNGRTVRVSNSFVFKDPVFNYSGEYPFLWDEISIMIRHESNEQLAEEIINDVAREVVGEYENSSKLEWKKLVQQFMIEDARVESFIAVTIDGNGINFTLRYITDYKSRRRTKDKLFRSINQRFKQTKGEVEWAISTLELSSRPAFEIKALK